MSKLEDIERAVAALSPEEMARFRDWFEAFDARLWDEQIARDARAGKLDTLAEKALEDHKAGRSTPL